MPGSCKVNAASTTDLWRGEQMMNKLLWATGAFLCVFLFICKAGRELNMKRRVLRAHANKRRMRLISAEHGLCLDGYNILCDASFLRAISTAICNHNLGRGCGDPSAVRSSPQRTLMSVMYQTFNAATSHTPQGAVAEGAEQPKLKGMTLSLYYLPETATTLRRVVRPGNGEKDAATQTGKCNGGMRASEKGDVSAVAEVLLKGLERVRYKNPDLTTDATQPRNEARAIAQFIADMKAGQISHYSIREGKNSHFFFVATQSHDVRRLLPAEAALIRFTAPPAALWIERNGDSFDYATSSDGSGRSGNWNRSGESSREIANGSAKSRNRAVVGPREGGKELSAADAAFMRHLSPDLIPTRRNEANLHRCNRGDTTKSGNLGVETISCNGGDGQQKAAAPVIATSNSKGTTRRLYRKGKARGPNPLSVKTKRRREVLRVEVSHQQHKKGKN